MAREFMGRRVAKETFSLGVGGTIERDLDAEETPPESVVAFEARAKVGAIKHKFAENGTVEETTILTIDPESFQIVGVVEKPKTEELPFDERAADGSDEAPAIETMDAAFKDGDAAASA